ncbi:hypothetical protein Bca52824_039398 [Brassica carinata]|uniref:Uncharacterized protein n=1 Tax=Brassica carinata TaxID=52824 RepID=A0A8X7RPA8_BRACI|nr:hypothetical protein Bca52824_039398 [Brassica carinata]
MSSRKGSSKRNSSSHSSSGDSSANEMIAPKEEFEVEEEAKDAYYKALCGSPPPSQDIPIPKKPVRLPNAPLTPSMGFWFTRGTGIDGSYRMAPKKGMAWFERFFFVRIDGESVEESYLHLFRREWNFTRVNRILPPTPADLFAKRDLLRSRPFFWNSFTVKRIRSAVELHRSQAVSQPLDGVAFENVLGNLPLPEWNPSFSPGERSGTSEVPLPSDFFADLPPDFTTHKSLDEESRRKVVAEGSSLINEGVQCGARRKFSGVVYLSLQSRGG